MAQTSVASAAAAVLRAAQPRDKIFAARTAVRDWRFGRLAHVFDEAMPDRPARPDRPELLPPSQMPRRGKGGSERGRIAMLHALAHIEFVAIDLAFDMVGRFGDAFPSEFTDDWMRVGAEEAMHFALLDRRLASLGSGYGALPAHDGLWESAEATAHDPLARLAIVPMVLEARGLDVTPATIERFERAGDSASARILARIMDDEVRHVAFGVKWFESRCKTLDIAPHQTWQTLVERYFGGRLKPPFNDSARRQAGLTRDFYMTLAR
ncbi:ferritin-like domain-containing protein [Parasphingopyxis sp.]|uniref:ferritin-like domain-containing protein n=1 Tax=Parasphingopyxis sp. TaxID=1920299 RepID=UPI00260549BE|nr:ferritin-like domain-containing protein [Parasphingopyxis sp.]